jgi:hypothetical protein
MPNEKLTEVKQRLAKAVALQKSLKHRRFLAGKSIGFCRGRFDRNGSVVDGRDLVPRRAAYDLTHAVLTLAKTERKIQENRKRIRAIEAERVALWMNRIFQKAMDRVFISEFTVTARDMVKKVLAWRGLYLHDNNEISGPGGKLIAMYGGDASYDGAELKWTVKPIQTLEFITIDIKIDPSTDQNPYTVKKIDSPVAENFEDTQKKVFK